MPECLFALVLSYYEEWKHSHCSLRRTKHFSSLSKAQKRTGRRGNEQPALSKINSSAAQETCSSEFISPKKLAGWVKTLGRRVTPGRMRGWDTFCIIICSRGLALLWLMLIFHTHCGTAREQPLWWNTRMGGRGMQCSSCFAWFRIKCSQHPEHLSQKGAVPYHQLASCWQSQHPQPHSWDSYRAISALRIM